MNGDERLAKPSSSECSGAYRTAAARRPRKLSCRLLGRAEVSPTLSRETLLIDSHADGYQPVACRAKWTWQAAGLPAPPDGAQPFDEFGDLSLVHSRPVSGGNGRAGRSTRGQHKCPNLDAMLIGLQRTVRRATDAPLQMRAGASEAAALCVMMPARSSRLPVRHTRIGVGRGMVPS